jgi:PKD repeat protein
VFAGGDFQGVGTKDRGYLASFNAANGALLDWTPQAAGGKVWAVALNPDGTKLAVGGQFTTLNGSSNPGYGLGMVDTTTGASLPMAVNSLVRNGGTAAGVTSLATDGSNVYGGGYTFGAGGTLEGNFGASWDGGTVKFINDCHGDTYSIYPRGGALYAVGHAHYCGNIGGFPQTPTWTFYRGLAFSTTATRTAMRDPYGYASFAGQPSSAPAVWYPSINTGTFTGMTQGPWAVAGNDDYVVMGGEFTKVNNKAQQGLVRFPKKELSPNTQGPTLFSTTYPLSISSTEAGKVRINWGTNQDIDNDNLTYKVYRDVQLKAGLVYETQARADFWAPYTMGFTDSGLEPGSTHQYRVAVTDPFGNIANSPWTTVTVAPSGTDSKYVKAVYAGQPVDYWRFGETSGSTGTDRVGASPVTLGAGVTKGVGGAIAGDTDKAASFSGASTGIAYTGKLISPPNNFTLEGWFKTNTNTGGKLFGFGDKQSSNSSSYDRHVYMDNAGRIVFGVNQGSTATVSSTATYRNDAWHYVAATLSSTGMKLYVDGALVGQRATPTYGQNGYWGYWRIGGDNLASWPQKPTSNFFKGSLDEVALYNRELTPTEVSSHYTAGTGGNVSPTAAFTETETDLGLAVDGSSSIDPDGTISTYAWTFGDGGTATGVTASHTYAAAGSYPVTLTVTDNEGATAAETKQVTVVAPNVPPVAAFTSSAHDLDLSVDASGSTDSDGTIASYAWTFGDGGTATGPTASHTYAAGGTYDVKLTVTDNKGTATNLTKQVTVTPPNVAPTAAFTSSGAELDKHFDATDSSDTDGTVDSFAWDFGDGESGSGSQVDHSYDSAGTYDVKLTVTDDDGATGTVTRQVVVSPPNAAPHAAFTMSKDELKLSVDASDSTDSDGTVESYAWTFGDGASGTGKTATHTYLGAGTYTVKLTVTDDDGAKDSVSKDIVITGPPAPFALDAFSRTVTGGWGNADLGGSWVRSGTSTNFAVSNGSGTIRMGSAGAGPSISLPAVSSSDTDMRVKVGLDKMPTGGGTYVTLKTRTVGLDSYWVDTKLLANGTVNVTLGRSVNGTDTSLQTKTVTGLTFNQGDKLNVRAQAVGTGSTTLRVKVWKVGSTEPTDWAASVADSGASLQAAGGIGLGTYLTGSSTNAPVIASFSDLSAAPTGN